MNVVERVREQLVAWWRRRESRAADIRRLARDQEAAAMRVLRLEIDLKVQLRNWDDP